MKIHNSVQTTVSRRPVVPNSISINQSIVSRSTFRDNLINRASASGKGKLLSCRAREQKGERTDYVFRCETRRPRVGKTEINLEESGIPLNNKSIVDTAADSARDSDQSEAESGGDLCHWSTRPVSSRLRV